MLRPYLKPPAGKQGIEFRMNVVPVPVMLPASCPHVLLFRPVSAFESIVLTKMYVLILDLWTFTLVETKLYKKLYAWSCHPKHAHSCGFDQNHIRQICAGSHLSEFVARS